LRNQKEVFYSQLKIVSVLTQAADLYSLRQGNLPDSRLTKIFSFRVFFIQICGAQKISAMVPRKVRQNLQPLLRLLSSVYGIIISIRNRLFDLGILTSVEFNFPVISVGNITVGGTGKTPHVEYLIRLLHKKTDIAILSRGYKRKTKGFVLADHAASPVSIGDESYQIWHKFRDVKVAVDERRVHGIRLLKNNNPELQCVILDDAFQHRYVHPGVSILLIDYYRPLNKDHMLPAGNLRELMRGIYRADIVIITKVPHEIKPIEKRQWIRDLNLFPNQFLYFTTFRYGSPEPVFNVKLKKYILDDLAALKTVILLVTGIVNPTPLYERLITCCISIEHLHYPDHHEYLKTDLDRIENCFNKLNGELKLIITTEKDAVKIRNLNNVSGTIKNNLYFIPVEVTFLDEKREEFDETILNYVTKNKRISRLHS
jgi:tetraacyldisaccharide 4'-kinase